MAEIYYEVKDEAGISIKEHNLEKKHLYPLGSLVEINCDYIDEHGCRLFVVRHSRDCDGTPLYDLSFDKTAVIRQSSEGRRIDSISTHYGEDCLILIR